MCDRNVNWVGWYRLFIQGWSAQMPETCVVNSRCGTDYPMWLKNGHPKVGDGVVSRHICYYWMTNCCVFQFNPIRVKACPGNYYVYEFVKPTTWSANMAYCADVMSINVGYTTVTPETTSTGINITLPDECKSQATGGCVENLFDQIENITAEVLPLNDVTNILDVALNTSEKIIGLYINQNELVSYGNRVLKASEKLISTLVKPTDTSDSVKFTLDTVEAQVFMVGPNVTLHKIPQLDTTNASVDIDLIGIAQNNQETKSAAVAFMSYTTMENVLRPDFFNTSDDSVKTMMSTVISATLPKTDNTKLTKPVNFTLKHIREFVSGGNLSCVYWNISEWIVDGCSVVKTNSSHTVCSCDHLSTFALIMQTSSPPEVREQDDPLMKILNLVAVIVGLVFLSLALLTFAFCRWNPGVNNVARINLCLSLLLAHLLFMLTQQFLNYILPNQVLCAVISGVLHFFFLSSFVWMFIEAVLIFICVKNLSQISSKQREVLSSRFIIVIGYVIALVVVGVSVGLVPEGYGSEKCWIKLEKGFIWSFLGPVCVLLALNTTLFISIIVSLNSTLTKLNAGVSQMKQTKILVIKTLSQFVVLGCPWILGFFTNNSKVVEILFLSLNSQQGTFIFLIYCVLNNEIRQQYVDWLSTIFPGLEHKAIKSAPQNS
ncbi:adhesion G protein-coupled receptor E3-like isoform X2 [Myxocyprinus asiaticus]|uniref:adhesion G protein-coupled receptor E3-like isoform X2 n=1 Tax=Myxocyprinus asiaticus TaxID=70543 RepID=UPI002221452E|nr:adhesion G protein-coupled receptor E3-like isoform X2 [Myxocyprinus asiaticus]